MNLLEAAEVKRQQERDHRELRVRRRLRRWLKRRHRRLLAHYLMGARWEFDGSALVTEVDGVILRFFRYEGWWTLQQADWDGEFDSFGHHQVHSLSDIQPPEEVE